MSDIHTNTSEFNHILQDGYYISYEPNEKSIVLYHKENDNKYALFSNDLVHYDIEICNIQFIDQYIYGINMEYTVHSNRPLLKQNEMEDNFTEETEDNQYTGNYFLIFNMKYPNRTYLFELGDNIVLDCIQKNASGYFFSGMNYYSMILRNQDNIGYMKYSIQDNSNTKIQTIVKQDNISIEWLSTNNTSILNGRFLLDQEKTHIQLFNDKGQVELIKDVENEKNFEVMDINELDNLDEIETIYNIHFIGRDINNNICIVDIENTECQNVICVLENKDDVFTVKGLFEVQNDMPEIYVDKAYGELYVIREYHEQDGSNKTDSFDVYKYDKKNNGFDLVSDWCRTSMIENNKYTMYLFEGITNNSIYYVEVEKEKTKKTQIEYIELFFKNLYEEWMECWMGIQSFFHYYFSNQNSNQNVKKE